MRGDYSSASSCWSSSSSPLPADFLPWWGVRRREGGKGETYVVSSLLFLGTGLVFCGLFEIGLEE